MRVADLPTPAAVVDLDRLEANARRMLGRARRLGVRLRPHAKTHKCLEAARIQTAGGAGLTVSTLAEARFFAAGGFRDLLYAVPVAPRRLAEVAAIARDVDRLGILADSPATVDAVVAAAAEHGHRFDVHLEVDCGYGRTGVDPERWSSLELARRLGAEPGVALCGLVTHAGHAYACSSPEAIREVARQEAAAVTGFARRLADVGVDVGEVSVGSTPTLSVVETIDPGVTEVRPGNYLFYDRFQATIGACSVEDVALTVAASVIGRYPERGELVVDAGALALSKDPGATHVDPDPGFGLVTEVEPPYRELPLDVVGLSQEHGKLRAREPGGVAGLEIGSTLRIVPNHSCMTAALFDRYHVARAGTVVDEWRPVRGW